MLFEMIVQAFLGVLAIFFSVLLIRSRKYRQMLIGIVLMGVGIVFTLTSGEILMVVMSYVPQSVAIKSFLLPFFPYVVGASFLAWFSYMSLAYFSHLKITGLLWSTCKSKSSKSDHLEAAKINVFKNQLDWLFLSFSLTIIAFTIIMAAWFRQDLFQSHTAIMVIGMVWVFVVPPFVIHTELKRPYEILALRELKSLASVKIEKISDYRELIAVMDEIKDEGLKKQLDGLIIDGLTEALIKHRIPEKSANA